MIYQRMCRYQKPTAWILFFVFYLQLVSPVLANAANRTIPAGIYTVASKENNYTNFLPTSSSVNENRLAEIDKQEIVLEKVVQKELKNSFHKKTFGPGPTQPEMQSFQSVNSSNMVDLFSGDFSYNIPLLDVGGYPVNIHYSSGITMDQEASWVGLGWNINPGTINRTMRGVPDDFNGTDKITKTLSMAENKTVGVTAGGNAELFGKNVPLSVGATLGVFHNTYNGWGTETGINAGINSGQGAKGNLSGSLGLSNNSQSGLDVSPTFSFKIGKEEGKTLGTVGVGTNFNSRIGIQSLQLTMQTKLQVMADQMLSKLPVNINSPSSVSISFATPSFTPGISTPFTSHQATFTAKVGGLAWAYHPNFFVSGSFSSQYIDPKDQVQSLPAYGYLYYQEAGDNQNVLLDFNREKEVAFRKSTPNIAIPSYTYDIYSISGEGTGGMFRPYRGDIGMIYDHSMATKTSADRISLDIGLGHSFHGGVDLNKVWTGTKNNPWLKDNVMARYIGFKQTDSLYENVYFKNPGEKTTVDQAFFDKVGDDKLMRVQLSPLQEKNASLVSATRNFTLFSNAKPAGTLALASNTIKTNRDKRTQVISYLNASEASLKNIGLDTVIKSYYINSFPSTRCYTNFETIKRYDDAVRKPHHLSEINVLGTDGRKYVYGVPVYDIMQQDVSFSVDKTKGNNTTGLVHYNKSGTNADNSPENLQGKEHYFSKEEIPSYAHSFLLSAILSPDYVDITGDGVTEDDNGNAVKFNYTRVYGGNNPYKWRAPIAADSAFYNEGLKTYSRDDRGSYSFGKKEVWYMNSIESKTMIATFVLETSPDSTRKDSYGVIDENGGRSSSQFLYRLKQINLYTKADFLKNNTNAKPVKSVHFEYTYELCNGNPSSNNTGKLTLKKIWFSYNKNYKGQKNPYVFTYNSTSVPFNSQANDRWGNYKDPDNNPGTSGSRLTNGEYPYTLQKTNFGWDSTKAATSVQAWTLNEIKLPSGGVMKVSYESDDYAYVQDRRAMQMLPLAGLGSDSTSALSSSLYPPSTAKKDYMYVYVRLNEAVSSKAELTERYFEGVSKLYFKLYVKMPDSKDGSRWGTGYEQIPCFADIEDYNIRSGSNNKLIWIRLAKLSSNSPLATAAVQFLRLNLPSKAYPYSEPGDNVGLKDVIGMILSAGTNVVSSVAGFGDAARNSNWCNLIDTSKSFLRLNTPNYKKFGGGLRVKKIEVFDNWNSMTTQTESTYGQTYDYSTIKQVNGNDVSISSGVASYEPALGKEENPFFQPIEYAEKMAALGPTDYIYTEEPLGESFFPGPGVGYSRVAVQTINKTKKSANGIDVTEFYTAKDFPVIVENTPLDGDSKKPYSNPIGNYLKFNAQRYMTVSQGFKIELNDMHGKMKMQSSFAQTDLVHPISYTLNYYKVDNDNAYKKHLSNKVTSADSSNGVLNLNSQMGKDIDVLVDIREQTSTTISASLQLNGDFAAPFFFAPSKPNLPSREVDRFRSIAVTKVVNRYAILDSVVHFDKGSKISTANMVYDGETGDVIVSRTQNEFDDPIYSFNYPAYWAYSGMEGAYKNIGATFKNVNFLNGRMSYKNQLDADIKKYFESGDELLFYGDIKRGRGNEVCAPENNDDATKFIQDTITKIWAIDVAKSGLGSSGIFFIDKDGLPVTGWASKIKIIRSGKRNLQSKSIGSITSLKTPVRVVNGVTRLAFDSTTDVIAASSNTFKDYWKVDSSSYRKDTIINRLTKLEVECTTLKPVKNYAVLNHYYKGRFYSGLSNYPYFEAYATSNGCGNRDQEDIINSWMLFDFNGIPANSVINSASLNLQAPSSSFPAHSQIYQRTTGSNSTHINRGTSYWIEDRISIIPPNIKNNWFFYHLAINSIYQQYAEYKGDGSVSSSGQITVPTSSSPDVNFYQSKSYDATTMVQGMYNSYYSDKKKSPQISMGMNYPGECNDEGTNRMSFAFDGGTCGSGYTSKYGDAAKSYAAKSSSDCKPYLDICFVRPGATGALPVYLTSPVAGYYGIQPRDSFVCKPNINDTATNPYRWGIWGNWQVDKTYAYFDLRKDSVASAVSVTNIRKEGVINVFKPYWSFTSGKLQAVEDIYRWLWTAQTDLINTKGFELQNHDQLNRYNSAQFGYNQTLPVAVAQNSRMREMVFDGFEDYGYTTDTCTSCPKKRFLNAVAGGTLYDSLSHSGVYSLKVAANQTDSIVIPVVTNDDAAGSIRGKASSFFLSTDTTVNGKGRGLVITHTVLGSTASCDSALYGGDMDYDVRHNKPPGFCQNRYSVTEFKGYIQPRFSEDYTFYITTYGRALVKINNIQISRGTGVESNMGYNYNVELSPIKLYASKKYPISIKVYSNDEYATAILKWKSASQSLATVPKAYLYPADTAGSFTVTNNKICTKLDTLRQTTVTIPNFSPIDSTLMLVSAWVREKGDTPDTVSTYRNAQVQIVFNNGTPITLKPSGRIIDGWQKVEDSLFIPANANQMKVRLMSTNGVPVYFDDIRMHPFNANLKTYVYNPVNLRLMAEMDENNYASFYEYDDDGTLIRVKKETEQGIKTIKETRSALQK